MFHGYLALGRNSQHTLRCIPAMPVMQPLSVPQTVCQDGSWFTSCLGPVRAATCFKWSEACSDSAAAALCCFLGVQVEVY